MDTLIFILFFCSFWFSNSSTIYIYLEKLSEEYAKISKKVYFSLSLGFLFNFISLSAINIALHSIGITFLFKPLLILFSIAITLFNKSNIKNFFLILFSNFKKKSFSLLNKISPIIVILSLVIGIQIICLFLRLILPVTHYDAFSQYFYDSLQISRLGNLNLSEYYQMGQYLRSDSLGSFFDAFIIQISDKWILVRSMRAIALILVLLSSLELAKNLGRITLRKSFLLVAIVLSLPDVWDVFLSGKHDGYVVLFELTGINAIILSIISKNKSSKVLMLFIGFFIGFMSIGIRLSSLAFLYLPITLFIYYVFYFRLSLFKNISLQIISSIPVLVLLSFVGIIISSSFIYFLNYKYLNNPLYFLSPPGFLQNIFPNAVSRLDYKEISEALNLRNIPFLIKPIITISYSALSAEPIRYVLNKFRESKMLFLTKDFVGLYERFLLVLILILLKIPEIIFI